MNSGTPPRSSSQRANNVSPLRSPPPRRSSPPRRRRRSNSNAEGHKDKKRAKELAQQLDSAIPVMLDKLFSHLSSLPEEEMQERGGVTLPASALGWLSSQFYIGEESSAMWASTRDRLRLLRFLLPRVTHLRITRQPWPPPLPSQSKSTSSNSAQATTSRRRQPRRPPLETLQATSSSSVCSALTTDTSFPTRTAFLQFMELLADRPTLDLRLFPYLQVLVLDSVPPYWISNFGLISEQLKILRIDKACLYQLPALFDSGTHENLTHLRLNYCGIGEMSKLPNLLRKLPNLLFLNLAHNELMQERTALRGLAKLGNLTKLDLSGNSLTQLPHANFYLGNIQTLILTGNSITELKGIEKLYGLETLHIGNNEISNVIQMLGLARLPSLQRLSYQGNPFLAKKPPGYKSKKTSYKQDYRLLILSWFLSNRDRRREELPVLNHKLTSDEEWKNLQTMSSHRFITGSTNTTKIQRVKRTCKRVRKARIGLSPFDTKTNDISREAVPTKQLVASFSVQDVLTSLQQKKQTAFPEDYEKPVEEKTDSAFKEVRKDSSSQEGMAADDQHLANGLQKDDLKEKASVGSSSASLPSTIVLMDSDEQQGEAKKVESPAPVDTSMEQQLREAVTQLSMSLLIEPNNAATSGENPKGDPDGNGNANNITNGMLKDDTAIAEVVRINDDEAMKANEKDLKGSSKRTSVKLQTGGAQQPDLFGADWEVIVQLAAAGLIPNGKLRTPVADVPQADQQEDIFSTTLDLLPGPEGGESKAQIEPRAGGASSVVTDDTSAVGSTIRSIPVENVYQDDFSVPSSLGTNDFPVQSKFQLAEDNAVYDGPDACGNMNVLKNLDLYFTTYVFRDSIPVSPEAEIKEEDWKFVTARYPRIQLWPEDRRSLETNDAVNPSHQMLDWAAASRERYVRVWEEEIIPCGKPALRRLAPNRRARLSFHGDQLFKDGVPYPYAECRKVCLCLSSAAVYIISKKDPITVRNTKKKKKKFPVPMKETSTFADAPWPHAVARHSYRDLKAIAIGFDFQRLTLRFSSSRRSDPFVYVLLTSNKKKTVKILQDIQLLAKESNEGVTDLVSDATAVAIENDSQVVFDALSVAVAPDLLGTVVHYQIVQQRWKHGDRGTVRRVCVVTDTKIFLLDEDYFADGHTTLESNSVKVGEVKFQIVDEASLPQVAEVQAAGADPRSITIVMNPLSRLSRTHRWRLLCRDSNGAERLVEDVRRALHVD